MEYRFVFETKENFSIKAYANQEAYRWECGGAFGSDWSEKKWYEGIMLISKNGTKWYFFFKTFNVKDADLPEFNHQNLFGDMSNREILDKCEKLAKHSENSPFPFVEVGRDFSEDGFMEDSQIRIKRGEDGWG